jgi:polyphenol oxidase
MEWRERGGVKWLEASLPGATAAFSTRIGGLSDPPFESLNLGALTDDGVEAIVENRRRLAAALGFAPENVAFGHQVHGAELAVHDGSAPQSSFASRDVTSAQRSQEGNVVAAVDGHMLTEPGTAALVFVADCVPVALAGRGGVAMLHCGWRGLAAGIVAKGVAATDATDAAVGPCIGPCCYEVGTEVLDALSLPTGRERDDESPNRPVGGRVDLVAVARRQLAEAGVANVELSGLCTSCEPGLFFSHRRDRGRTGRQAGLVWLEDGES